MKELIKVRAIGEMKIWHRDMVHIGQTYST